ncbi:MAG: sulfatase/phosphatase domain-containing protein, partial [Bacteroidota bacterium]
VFFFSDHGMRLWRHKQFLYEGGLKVPCVLRYYGQKQQLEQGSVIDDLVSGIDIGITSLGFAGIGIPSHAEGRDIFAEDYSPREFVISARDRCDYTIDQIRSVRTVGYKYIKNFKTDRPYMQPNYKDEWEITQIMRKEYADGNLNEVQERFWKSERPEEELYDLVKDPDEIHNLALDPNYEAVMRRHRDILNDWIADTDDQGQYPEDEEGLKVMLGIWGERCINPEYDKLKAEQPELSGTLEDMKS